MLHRHKRGAQNYASYTHTIPFMKSKMRLKKKKKLKPGGCVVSKTDSVENLNLPFKKNLSDRSNLINMPILHIEYGDT